MEPQQRFSPDSADQAVSEAVALHRAGRRSEAEKIYRQILVRQPSHPHALQLLGVCYGQRGEPQKAVDLISRAVAIRPNVADYHGNLGEYLRALGRMPESIASFERAVALDGSDPVIRNSFGVALAEARQLEAAIAQFRRAIELKGDYADPHSNLGAVLNSMDRLDEAMAEIQTAIAMNPQLPGAYNNLGNVLFGRGEFARVISVLSNVLSSNPDDAKIHANLALAYLVTGDFERGWCEYEWRLRVPAIVGTRQIPQPRWDGGDLQGKTILLHAEQGFGDMIQFARFIPRVAGRGGRVILECPVETMRLFRDFPGVSQLAERDKPLPDFDVQCPLMSLAGLFGVTEQTIPREVPYLKADPELARQWAGRFDSAGDRLRVGLAWAGRPEHAKDRNRSMKLEQFAPLASVQNAAFYSLQMGQAAAQAAHPPSGLNLTDWTKDVRDFADTAAMVAHLDLLVTVDTSVAHLAGAMGKPVWLLLPHIPDWRWMLDRSDSPWYPTMRLFRQTTRGDWADVLRRVVEAFQMVRRSG
ncbi:MAG: tetratricopeptide repeat-containing glycosyltransferase family protein [Tepidisphaeraceae bacterium]